MDENAVRCTLEGPALIERIIEWRQVASRATGRRVETGRIVSTYPSDPELIERLRALIAAEAECCSFMEFDVVEEGDEVTVELRVPDGMSDVLVAMMGLVGGSGIEPLTSSV